MQATWRILLRIIYLPVVFGIMLCYSIIQHNDFEGHYANCIIKLAIHYASHLGSFIVNDLLTRSIPSNQKPCEVNGAIARRGDVL